MLQACNKGKFIWLFELEYVFKYQIIRISLSREIVFYEESLLIHIGKEISVLALYHYNFEDFR